MHIRDVAVELRERVQFARGLRCGARQHAAAAPLNATKENGHL